MSQDDSPEVKFSPRAEALSDNELDELDQKWGCYTRTLESITGQKATRKDKLARINHFFTAPLPSRWDIDSEEDFKYWADSINRYDIELVDRIKTFNTPLGQAINNLEFEGILSGSLQDFMGMVEIGKSVGLFSFGYEHMFHLGKKNGKWYQLSDNNQVIEGIETVDPTLVFNAFVFSPRTEDTLPQANPAS